MEAKVLRKPLYIILSPECLKIIVPHLCGHCGGAVSFIKSIFTQLHRSGFNLEFETLFGSI